MIEAYSTSKNILFTSSLGTFGRLIGFATNLLVAYLFGANNKTDILFYCIIFFSSLNGLFNSFNSNILLSQFILIKQERSESDAWQFVNTVFSVISCAMVIMIFLLFLYYEHIILIFSRFSAQDINSVKLGILLIIPTMYLLYISDLIINVIQAHKNFFITSVVPLIGGIVQIVGLFFFAQMFEETSIAIAYFLSSAAQALVLYHWTEPLPLHRLG
jgi:peptidoglycan biosynthesis protein MviN/MurJ (putative lipid II flippase)